MPDGQYLNWLNKILTESMLIQFKFWNKLEIFYIVSK